MLVASAAHAQGGHDSSPEYVEARNRLQEGKTLYGQGNIDGARLKFEQACAVLEDARVPARARPRRSSTRSVTSKRSATCRRALDDPELDTVERKQVTDLMQQAYDKTGHLEVHAPAGGHVRIDDTIDVGNAPLTEVVHVTVGSHVVSVTVEEKTERKNDGVRRRQSHQSRLQRSISASRQRRSRQQPAAVDEEHKTMFPPPTGAIVTGVVGFVGIGFGIGFGVASSDANSTNLARGLAAGGVCSSNPNAQVCVDGKSTRDSQQTDALISTIGYVAGGVALVTALVWWIAAPRKVVEHKALVVPTVGPHTAGAAFTFSF